MRFLKKILPLFIITTCLFFVAVKSVSAQTCGSGGQTLQFLGCDPADCSPIYGGNLNTSCWWDGSSCRGLATSSTCNGTPPNCNQVVSSVEIPCGGGGGGGGGSCTEQGNGCSSDSECCSGRCNSSGVCGSATGPQCTDLTPVDCPPGTVRGSTIVGSQCSSYACNNSQGSAQEVGACCRWVVIAPRVCGPWTCGGPCGTPSNPNRCCRECTEEEIGCGSYTFNQYNCVGLCNATAPSNVVATRVSESTMTLTWTPGTASSQSIYIGANRTEVEAGCPGASSPACVVAITGISSGSNSFTTSNVLTAGTVYFARVVSVGGSSCPSASSTTVRHLSSCNLSPATATIYEDQTQTYTMNINSSSEIARVDFASANTSVATINAPISDTTYPYQGTALGVDPGTTNITAIAYFTGGGSIACNANAASGSGTGNERGSVTVLLNLPAWWQVKDGDVTAANGSIQSTVAATNYFDTIGAGGFPGVPVYSGSLNVGSLISTTNWNANTGTTLSRLFDYAYFENLVPDNITPTAVSGTTTLPPNGTNFDGYEIFKASGSLTLDTMDLRSRKVILLVDNNSNLTINGTINLDNNVGFFGAFVDGSINIAPTVTGAPALEGIYLSDNGFATGASDTLLHIRGSVASYGGFSLQRNLPINLTPAELFEYAPDQILLFPRKFGFMRTKWSEIAP